MNADSRQIESPMSVVRNVFALSTRLRWFTEFQSTQPKNIISKLECFNLIDVLRSIVISYL